MDAGMSAQLTNKFAERFSIFCDCHMVGTYPNESENRRELNVLHGHKQMAHATYSHPLAKPVYLE